MTESDFALSAVKKEMARQATNGPDLEAGKASPQADDPLLEPDEHEHYSQRAPWLRAGVLGANDGLVSVASLMIGVGGGSSALHIMILAGQYCTESTRYKRCLSRKPLSRDTSQFTRFVLCPLQVWLVWWAVRSAWQSASTSL